MILLLLQACFLLNDLGLAPADSALLAADPVCSKYLTCVAAVEPGELSALVDTYGESGSCWGDEATAEACATACDSELDALREENPDEPECGGTVPSEEWPFRDGHWDASVIGVGEDSCGAPDEDTLATLSYLVEEYGMSFSTDEAVFPDFRASMMLLGLDCTLDGDEFFCAGDGFDGNGAAELAGRFSGETHAEADMTLGDGGACFATLPLALTAKE